MARYTGSKCRLCRREGMKLFLKGDRCMSAKCAVEKRQYPPGEHGQRMRIRRTEYGLQLREKQKVKRVLKLLELRRDNVAYRAGFAPSRNNARQLVNHRHFTVNGRVVSIPSYSVKVGDVIQAREKIGGVVKANLDRIGTDAVPWLQVDGNRLAATVLEVPSREGIPIPVQEQLIVELYSK
jgi:small subunit ribosomal protein S4